MQTSSPETAQTPAPDTDDVLAQFLADHVEPMRAEQARFDAARPDPLPKASRLLAEALAARRIAVKKVTDRRWVFEFAGSVIGGYFFPTDGGGVSTLVSAQARRVLADADKIRAHFDLVDIPHPAPMPEPSGEDATPPLFDLDALTPEPTGSRLQLRAYAVGPEAVSVLAVVPGEGDRALSVDATEIISGDLATLAVDAMRAIPGLLCAAVAIQTPSLESAEGAEVVAIDEAASIIPHHFPHLGPGRPVADAIAEQILFTAAL